MLLGCWGTVTAQTADGRIRTLRNIPYVSNGSEFQQLDLYLPDDSKTPHPLVIWIHGGGWEGGTKAECPAKSLVPLGYAAVSLGYRLSQQAIYPAQIEDCKAAVRWLRAHASEYGVAPKDIGVWGESAGGHLVALLGTTGKIRDFDIGENLNQSSDVQCVVDWFGPTDFLHWGESNNARLDSLESAVSKLLGGSVSSHQELARRSSPVTFVSRDSAPFLIMHGDQDRVVPVQQGKKLNEALRKTGAASILKILLGAGHCGPAFNSPENMKMITDFFDQHLASSRGILRSPQVLHHD